MSFRNNKTWQSRNAQELSREKFKSGKQCLTGDESSQK